MSVQPDLDGGGVHCPRVVHVQLQIVMQLEQTPASQFIALRGMLARRAPHLALSSPHSPLAHGEGHGAYDRRKKGDLGHEQPEAHWC